MNLETALQPKLWNVIRSSIEAKKFSPAILDAMHVLGDAIRERTGLESDGTTLVGHAFGTSSPKLKVTLMRTESEKNIQEGTQFLLRGLFQAVRNPRSHETYNDSEKDAIPILLFIDYLLRVVDKSGSPFSLNSMVARILDDDYVASEEYSELIIKDIPAKKRLAVCREVISKWHNTKPFIIVNFYRAMFKVLHPEELKEIYSILSNYLTTTSDSEFISYVINTFPKGTWLNLERLAKMRIENKLIQIMGRGKYVVKDWQYTEGEFALNLIEILPEMIMTDSFWSELYSLMCSYSKEKRDYAAKGVLATLDRVLDQPPDKLVSLVTELIKQCDRTFLDLIDFWSKDYERNERPVEHPWRKPFVWLYEEIKNTPEYAKTDETKSPFYVPF